MKILHLSLEKYRVLPKMDGRMYGKMNGLVDEWLPAGWVDRPMIDSMDSGMICWSERHIHSFPTAFIIILE
jgi:hypothetical protein